MVNRAADFFFLNHMGFPIMFLHGKQQVIILLGPGGGYASDVGAAIDLKKADTFYCHYKVANTSLTESLNAEEMCKAYRAWVCVIPACVPKLKVTYGILWGNLCCYMVLKLCHLHMLISKSLALPKVLMLSVVWVSAKPPITPHCLERLEFSPYMSELA